MKLLYSKPFSRPLFLLLLVATQISFSACDRNRLDDRMKETGEEIEDEVDDAL